MVGRRIEQRNVRSLTKVAGHSFGITLPVELVRILGWRPRQKLVIKTGIKFTNNF